MEVKLAKTAGFCFGVKRAVETVYKEAEKNNDLVIVAGDGSNDFEMLNPAYYLKNYLNKNHT